MNPKRIDFTDETWPRSGIDVEYVKSRKMLYFSGWYDSNVGIEGGSLSLADFCQRLGIEKKDLP